MAGAEGMRDILRSLIFSQLVLMTRTAAHCNMVVASCGGSSLSSLVSERASNRFLVTVAGPHAGNLLVSGELDAAKPHDFAGVLGA